LENVIERAMVLSHEILMCPEDLPQYITSTTNGKAHPAQRSVLRGEIHLAEAVDEFEEELIRAALVQADFNQTRAAEILGTTRRILKYKMDKLGITSEERAAS
jgi:DNA-binding NtrC family response regulator